jgi:hypothetical protein
MRRPWWYLSKFDIVLRFVGENGDDGVLIAVQGVGNDRCQDERILGLLR